ncbi:MAG: glycosyltransferase, partial [Lachnospiraceae bacterium]|nr:glycosyltransferase [Lachnospiraceae bacterium]
MISVVIPCYNSSRTIRKVVTLTAEELERLGYPEYEFVLVDDCSPDDGATAEVLRELSHTTNCVKAVLLAHNAGQHNAIMAALNYAAGDTIIGMDDDMQTHPSQLGKLLAEFEKGYDLVYGYYPEKKHSGFRNFGSYINYISSRILIGKPKWLRSSSYWVIRKFVRDYVIQY